MLRTWLVPSSPLRLLQHKLQKSEKDYRTLTFATHSQQLHFLGEQEAVPVVNLFLFYNLTYVPGLQVYKHKAYLTWLDMKINLTCLLQFKECWGLGKVFFYVPISKSHSMSFREWCWQLCDQPVRAERLNERSLSCHSSTERWKAESSKLYTQRVMWFTQVILIHSRSSLGGFLSG